MIWIFVAGAGTMLVGVLAGYVISSASIENVQDKTEETAKWTQDIDEVTKN